MEICQLYNWVLWMCCVVIDTINEGEGVEGQVDEGEPEKRSYFCCHPLSLCFGLFIVEPSPTVAISPHFQNHRQRHKESGGEEEVERDVPENKLQDLAETIAAAVLCECSYSAPTAGRSVGVLDKRYPAPEERDCVGP